jgi:SAM-dependent methyltransferase
VSAASTNDADKSAGPRTEPGADACAAFFASLQQSLNQGSFLRLILAKPKSAANPCSRITVRKVVVRNDPNLSFVESHPTNDVTKNYGIAEGIALLTDMVGPTFLRAHLFDRLGTSDLSISKKGRAALHVTAISLVEHKENEAVIAQHDRAKRRFVDQSAPYLHALGVTDVHGVVIPNMSKKWKQINKFIEIVDGAVNASSLKDSGSVSVLDFGSGKGYLTFALHEYLRQTITGSTKTVGIEIRPELVDASNFTATKIPGLRFATNEQSSDAKERQAVHVDILVALHACDVATDIAIHRGIVGGASIIVTSPCCHKELRPQLTPPTAMMPVLSHGVHLGQEAEMVTDTIRALLLDAHGYDAKVFEFVGLEHSSKNKMILAVKRANANSALRQTQVDQELTGLKTFYGIRSQKLEDLLDATIPK